MPTPPYDDDLHRLEQDYQSGRRARRRLRLFRGPGGTMRKGLFALGVFLLFGGLIQIAQYVDTATVPGGVAAQRAEVIGVAPVARSRGESASRHGRTATVRLPDGSPDTVYLARRLAYPDAGDVLTVYREDGELRTTAERSRLGLAGGIAAVVLLPVLGLVYWRRTRRQTGRDQAAGDT